MSSAREEALYEPATDYDVWLRYGPDGVVEEAVFVRLGSARPANDTSD